MPAEEAVVRASLWLSTLVQDGEIRLGRSDETVLAALIEAAGRGQGLPGNISAWLRARAEIALARPDDAEQPGHEELAQGWRQGSYNSLHTAANAVDRGEALLPPDQWPSYLRNGQLQTESDK